MWECFIRYFKLLRRCRHLPTASQANFALLVLEALDDGEVNLDGSGGRGPIVQNAIQLVNQDFPSSGTDPVRAFEGVQNFTGRLGHIVGFRQVSDFVSVDEATDRCDLRKSLHTVVHESNVLVEVVDQIVGEYVGA